MKKQDNEQLCALAQKGDTEARDLLLKNNMGFWQRVTSVQKPAIWNRRAASVC